MEQQEEVQREPRNLIVRALLLLIWLLIFYFVTAMLVGAVVGGIAGAHTNTAQQGYIAGQQATIAFFHQYGHVVQLVQLITFALLAFLGIFPGTGKYKK